MSNAKRVTGKLFGGAVLAGAMMAFASQADAGLILDLRLDGGGKQASVNATGQVLNLNVFAVVTGAAGNGAPEGFWNAFYSVMSEKAGGGASNGDLSVVTDPSPWDGNGSQPGKQQDLNGDGNLDVGGTTSGPDWVFPRAPAMQEGNEFLVGTLKYTVKDLTGTAGGVTQINLVTRAKSITVQPASWREDGVDLKILTNGGKVPVGAPVLLIGQAGPVAFLALQDTGDGAQGTIHMSGSPGGYLSNVVDVTDTAMGSVALVIDSPGPAVPPVLAAVWLTGGTFADLKTLIPDLDAIPGNAAGFEKLAAWYAAHGGGGEIPDAFVNFAQGPVPGNINWDFGTGGLQIDKIAAVPEPAGLTLLGLGALGLMARRRRA